MNLFKDQMIKRLLISLLILLNAYVFIQFKFLTQTISDIISTVSFPLIMSLLFYYLIRPFVNLLEKRGVSKKSSIAIVFIFVFGFIVIGISSILPTVQSQMLSISTSLPTLKDDILKKIVEFAASLKLLNEDQIEQLKLTLTYQSSSYIKLISTHSLSIANELASSISHIVLSLAISPFFVFYFLNDGNKIKHHFVRLFKVENRKKIDQLLSEIDTQVSTYVQGQITVSIVVGVMFVILFNIIKLPYATTFGIAGGILNMIPYFGSMMISLIVTLFSISISPVMTIKTLVCLVTEQTIEGRIVTPLIIGKQLDIHPITITLILISANAVFGLFGVFLAIPIYSILKLLVIEYLHEIKNQKV